MPSRDNVAVEKIPSPAGVDQGYLIQGDGQTMTKLARLNAQSMRTGETFSVAIDHPKMTAFHADLRSFKALRHIYFPDTAFLDLTHLKVDPANSVFLDLTGCDTVKMPETLRRAISGVGGSPMIE